MWWNDGPGGWEWISMGFMMAIVWLPLLLVVLWALRQFGQTGQPPKPPGSGTAPEPTDAREFARRAYARGEMTREQFLRVIEDLDRTEGRAQ